MPFPHLKTIATIIEYERKIVGMADFLFLIAHGVSWIPPRGDMQIPKEREREREGERELLLDIFRTDAGIDLFCLLFLAFGFPKDGVT